MIKIFAYVEVLIEKLFDKVKTMMYICFGIK